MAESAAFARRGFAGGARNTTLSAGITAVATTLTGVDLSTWTTVDDNGPFRFTVSDGTNEEEMEGTAVSGNSITGITRGVGGTTAQAWDANATISHESSVRDFDEANYTAAETVGKITTAGDILVSDGANSLKRLAMGTARQNLSVNSGATDLAYQASLQSLMTAAGDIVYASSANTPARLAKGTASQVLTMNSGATAPEWATPSSGSSSSGAIVATSETTTSTSYTDLATAGPAITVTTGTTAVIAITCDFSVSPADRGRIGVAVSGASTVAASDAKSLNSAGAVTGATKVIRLTGLTAGSNTFTLKYLVGSGTGPFLNREIVYLGA